MKYINETAEILTKLQCHIHKTHDNDLIMNINRVVIEFNDLRQRVMSDESAKASKKRLLAAALKFEADMRNR